MLAIRCPELTATAVIVLALLTACGGAAPTVAPTSAPSVEAIAPTPPEAQRIPHTTEIHGVTLDDDYYWMREREDPEVIAYLEAENAYTEAMMAHTEALQEALYNEMVGRIQETDLSVPYRFVSGMDLERGELDGLRLLIMPSCYCLTPEEAEALDAWVRCGGTLVCEAHLGGYNAATNRHSCVLPGCGLAEKWGLREVETLSSHHLELGSTGELSVGRKVPLKLASAIPFGHDFIGPTRGKSWCLCLAGFRHGVDEVVLGRGAAAPRRQRDVRRPRRRQGVLEALQRG